MKLSELTPLEHFHSLVMKAITDQGVTASEMAEYYLSSLLAGFIDCAGQRLSREEPFAIRLLKALAADRDRKGALLKELGDSSLFLSGFFQESLRTRTVDIDYYIDVGAISYFRLADYFGRTSQREDLSQLYAELSEKFKEFVDVLTEVSERSRMSTPGDVLRLYERWLRTKSRHTEALLRELGIIPISVPIGPVH